MLRKTYFCQILPLLRLDLNWRDTYKIREKKTQVGDLIKINR